MYSRDPESVCMPGLKEDNTVFRKTIALILSVVLAVLSIPAASAEEPGIFGKMAEGICAGERMNLLEEAAEEVSVSVTAEDGTKAEVCQAYYEGNRVFVSYRMGANTDFVILHEGAPDEEIEWSVVTEDWISGEAGSFGFEDLRKEADWLDGKGQRWLEGPYDMLQDALMLEDGTETVVVEGEQSKLKDGSVIGWMECLIPEEKAEDTMTFSLSLSLIYVIKFQDFSTFREYWENRGKTYISFTLNRNGTEVLAESFPADGG